MYKQLNGFLGRGSPRKLLIFVNCRGPGSAKGLRRARDDVANAAVTRCGLSVMFYSERRKGFPVA